MPGTCFESTIWWPLDERGDFELGDCLEVRQRVWACQVDGPARFVRWQRCGQFTDSQGYVMVKAPGGYQYMHAVVAGLIHGPRPPGLLVRHLDDNKANNLGSNLAYDTQADNISDAIRNGTFQSGERNGRAKLTVADVAEVRRWLAAGKTVSATARHFGVSNRAISKIRDGENWAAVAR